MNTEVGRTDEEFKRQIGIKFPGREDIPVLAEVLPKEPLAGDAFQAISDYARAWGGTVVERYVRTTVVEYTWGEVK